MPSPEWVQLHADAYAAIRRMERQAREAPTAVVQEVVDRLERKQRRRRKHKYLDEPDRTTLRIAQKELATRNAITKGA